MKRINIWLIKITGVSIMLFVTAIVFAQDQFSLSGKISNQQGEALESATVFLNGSTRASKTNADGRFEFGGLSSGTYEIVVSMIGYSSVKEAVIISSGSTVRDIILQEKNIQLEEVVIGNYSRRAAHLQLFFNTFIGETKNAKGCKILNPEVIEFSTKSKFLMATSNEFILVENQSLGYRIRYLLRYFRYDAQTKVTLYDGECIFESLKGKPADQKKWTANRSLAYNGSLMHYLRSLYAGNTRQQGFIHYPESYINSKTVPKPLDVNQFVSKAADNLVQFQFNQKLRVVYFGQPAGAKSEGAKSNISIVKPIALSGKNASNIKLHTNKALIDSKGNYLEYNSFLIQGNWGKCRIADQLPFEYVQVTSAK